jgi:hypothetical protein
MGKRKTRRTRRVYSAPSSPRRARSFTIPIAPVAGLAAGMAEPAQKMIAGDFNGGLQAISRNYTGYDPATAKFNIAYLSKGALPLLTGLVVHKAASVLGINRMLGQAKVPIIRI